MGSLLRVLVLDGYGFWGIDYDDYERMTASARRRAKGILYAEFGNHLHPEPSGCIVQDST